LVNPAFDPATSPAVMLKEAKLGEANLRSEKQCSTYRVEPCQISQALLGTTKVLSE
jgi:hypothetical protein